MLAALLLLASSCVYVITGEDPELVDEFAPGVDLHVGDDHPGPLLDEQAGRSGTGQRLYTRDQVELILEIRHLLFEEGLTIAGARKRIAALQEEGAVAPAAKSSTRKSRSKTSSAARKVVPTTPDVGDVPVVDSDEVDKQAAERVQPLVAALRNVRQELSEIVAELGSDSA